MSFITIAVQCHHFQRRLCWMLSSLADQTQPGLVEIDIAYVENNGQPSTESVVGFFSNSLCIRSSLWEDYCHFRKRGLVRNRQLSECRTEWLLFSDCDMVYHPEYLERLQHELNQNHQQATYMISAGRISQPIADGTELVNSWIQDSPFRIPDGYAKADTLPKIPRRNVGAGFSQLINCLHAPHGGIYVDPETNRDWDWEERAQNPRSDIQFRKRLTAMGGPRQSLPQWFSSSLIHLNHNRDLDAGRHLEEQR